METIAWCLRLFLWLPICIVKIFKYGLGIKSRYRFELVFSIFSGIGSLLVIFVPLFFHSTDDTAQVIFSVFCFSLYLISGALFYFSNMTESQDNGNSWQKSGPW